MNKYYTTYTSSTFIWTVALLLIAGNITAQQAPFVTTWVTDNPGNSGDTEIIIPTNPSLTYNYEVDWDYDGVTFTADDTGVTGTITHDYGEIDTVTVAIRGNFPAIRFNSTSDREKIINIDAWGEIAWESFRGAFSRCSNLNSDATDIPDLTGVLDMTSCFARCTVFNGAIGDWDVSNVTSMAGMFFLSFGFNQPIGDWDVSNVTDMGAMFNGAIAFNQPIGDWDVGNVTDMGSMLQSTTVFNQPIGDWDVSNVTDMEQMFDRASVFNQPIGDWDVSNVTDMERMFRNAREFNQPIGDWDVSNVTNMSNIFASASAFNQSIGDWDISNVANMSSMLDDSGLSLDSLDATLIGWSEQMVQSDILLGLDGLVYCEAADAITTLTDPDGPNWTISGGTMMCPAPQAPFVTTWVTTAADTKIEIPTNSSFMYDYDVDWNYDGVTFDTDTSGVTGNAIHDYMIGDTVQVAIRGIFPTIRFNGIDESEKIIDINAWGDIDWESFERSFLGCSNLNSSATDIPDLSNVTSMELMFFNARNFNTDIGGWNVQTITNMRQMFQGATVFNSDISDWDVRNVTDMSLMFTSATAFNIDIGEWDVQNVTDMSDMFSRAEAFNSDISDWNVQNVTNMNGMFSSASSFNSDISDWNVQNVTNMNSMFTRATAFNSVISNWNVQNVTDMSNMFSNATAFNSDISNWNVQNVTTMDAMFNRATVFNSDISNWNVQNVTGMSNMFSDATAFNSDLGNWDVQNVISMSSMFSGATVFNSDISNWNVQNVTFMGGMFNQATVFNSDISDWNVQNVTGMSNMFRDAAAFNSDLGNWDVQNVIFMSSMFSGATVFNSDISNWNVQNVTNMITMFAGAAAFNSDISNWNVQNVTSMFAMFAGATAFNSDISNWSVQNVTNMQSMFSRATAFNSDISEWNVQNVTSMFAMFAGATVFNSDISEWDVQNVTNMRGMFFDATAFNSDLSNWDVQNVTNMAFMLDSTAISIEQLDTILIKWSALEVEDNISLGAAGLSYCNGADALSSLMMDHNWTLTGATEECPEFDLALTKLTSTTQVTLGDKVFYTINVANQGIDDAQNIVITDYIPAGLTFLAADNTGLGWTGADGTTDGVITNSMITDLDIGQATSISLILTVTDLDANLTNAAEISSAQNNNGLNPPDADSNFDGINDDMVVDRTGANDHVTIDNTPDDEDDHDIAIVTVAQLDLALTVLTSTTEVSLSDKVLYTINVANQGVVDARNIVITDYIPAGLTFLAADNTGLGWTGADGTTDGIITNSNITDLDIGLSTSISLTLTVTDLDANLTNAAEISSAQNDNGLNPPDDDSSFDNINDDMVIDQTGSNDHVTVDNATGDEDDHDIAIVTAIPAQIIITQSGDTTITTEAGTTDEVMIRLSRMPSSDVIVNVTVDDSTEGVLSLGNVAASIGQRDIPTLKSNTDTGIEITFTTGDWDIPRPVIVTGIDDEIVDEDITYNLSATVDDASSDDDYDGVSSTISVTNQDDGEPCLTNTPTISSVDVINSVLCGSFATGEIIINIAGSTDNIEYSIDNGATWTSSNRFTDLDGDTYAVLARFNNGNTICTIDEALMTELVCVIDLSSDASRTALTDALISGPSHLCPNETGTYQFTDSVVMCVTLIDVDPISMESRERDSCFMSAVVPDAQSYIWFSSEEDVTTVETATDLSPLLTIDHSGVADSTDLVLFITDSSGDVYSINQTVHLLTEQECSLYQCLQSAHVSREDMINNNVPTLVTMQEEITSDGLVQFRTTFDFRAGDNIELQAGFEVESGGTFVAIIEGCDVNDPTTKD